ncbi:MAG: FAD-dependent oxidoreductase [Planctomycetota bacterium]
MLSPPIMAMIRHMHDTQSDLAVLLMYANRTESDIVFRAEPDEIATSGHPRLSVAHVLSRPDESWHGPSGHIDVEVIGQHVDKIEQNTVVTVDRGRLHADVVVVATGLNPPSLLEGLGLPLDPDSGLPVGSTLHGGDARIFATKDCASLEGHQLPKLGVFGVRQAPTRIFATKDCASLEGRQLPKLGVFGVRQAPILLHNLAALFRGRPLKRYRPQNRALMILNLGCQHALAVYGNLHWLGRLSF